MIDQRSLIPPFSFSRDTLQALANKYGEAFRRNDPFPHVAIEDFLPDSVAARLAAEFPQPNEIPWRLAGPGDAVHTNDPNVEKISTSDEEMFPPFVRHVMHEFNSGVFINFLTDLTGFSSLSPDPWYHGCGLHSTGRGGRLMIHADASRHPNPKLHQILNVIYYVTPNWHEEWGGQLELWNSTATNKVKSIAPKFNSMVVFFTGSDSYHGHPHSLNTPNGVRRNSLATYFYTTDRIEDDNYSGYKNYVEWKRTNELDMKVSPYHVGKQLVRKYLPSDAVNMLATIVRRRSRKKS